MENNTNNIEKTDDLEIRCPTDCGGLIMTVFQLENAIGGSRLQHVRALVPQCEDNPVNKPADCQIKPEDINTVYEFGRHYGSLRIEKSKGDELLGRTKVPMTEAVENFFLSLEKRGNPQYMMMASVQGYRCIEPVPKEVAQYIKAQFG